MYLVNQYSNLVTIAINKFEYLKKYSSAHFADAPVIFNCHCLSN